MCYSCITIIAIWVYIEKDVIFPDISNPKTSISKIIDLIRPDDEWAEIAFSGRQNDENEHYETLKELVHKLNFFSSDMLIHDINCCIRVLLL